MLSMTPKRQCKNCFAKPSVQAQAAATEKHVANAIATDLEAMNATTKASKNDAIKACLAPLVSSSTVSAYAHTGEV